jgi:hypothetical protein
MPDDNTQQPQPTVSTVDQNQITPEIADPTQAQPAPSLFQSAMAPVTQQQTSQQPPTPADPAEQAKAARDKQLDFHPLVTAAHVARKVGEAISGGTQYKETFDESGNVTRTPIPPTTKSIITGALANILGGMGQMAGGALAASQHRAPPPPQPLPTQVAQQQRNQQSEEDYNRQENAKVQKAKVITANLEAMRAGYAVGKEDDDAKDAYIANHSSDLQQYQKDGIVEASKIPSDQLMSKGFDKSKYTVIPDGRVPVFKQDGSGERATNSDGVPLSQLTYSVVNGVAQTPLTQDNYDQYVKYGLMKSSPNFKLPEGATISTATQATMKHKLDLLGQTQREIDEVAGDGKVNLAAKLRDNPSLLKDIENFHNDAASQDPLTQLQNVRAKHPASAGAIVDLLGGQPVLDAYAAKTQTAEDLTADKAQSIVSDPKTDKNSPAYQKAVNFLKNSRTQKAQTAADETTARTQAEAAAAPAGLTVPAGFTPNPTASEMESADLQKDLASKGVKVPSNYAALYAIAHNTADLKTLPTRTAKGTNQMDAQTGLAFIRQYINPQYQEGDYAAASGLSKELASTKQGTAGGSLLSAGVASNHLELLDQASTALGNNDTQALNKLANTLGVQFGKSNAVTFQAIADQVNQEVGKVVAGGTPHEAELENLRKNLNSDQSPEQTRNVIKSYIGLMSGRVNGVNERSQQYFGRDVKGVSPETAKTFAKYGVAVPGYVQVKVNGLGGVIPKSKLVAFKKQYPNAEVQQ